VDTVQALRRTNQSPKAAMLMHADHLDSNIQRRFLRDRDKVCFRSEQHGIDSALY
jgi:hypothetical protein